MSSTQEIQKKKAEELVDKYVKPGSAVYAIYLRYYRIKKVRRSKRNNS